MASSAHRAHVLRLHLAPTHVEHVQRCRPGNRQREGHPQLAIDARVRPHPFQSEAGRGGHIHPSLAVEALALAFLNRELHLAGLLAPEIAARWDLGAGVAVAELALDAATVANTNEVATGSDRWWPLIALAMRQAKRLTSRRARKVVDSPAATPVEG